MSNLKSNRRLRIKRRIRKNISGTSARPRLSVFRSNKQIYAQLIDDINGVTLASASSYEKDASFKGNKIDQANLLERKLLKMLQKQASKTLFLIEMVIYITVELKH